jgi:peptidoglycan/LPS O-acetylase OafA/YrhL
MPAALQRQQQLSFGATGVTLFFVLSGFLITYTLLKEKENIGKSVALKKFYIRRILRIWPLYFFILMLIFLVINNLNFFNLPGYSGNFRPHIIPILIFYILLLPQVPFIVFPNVSYANILWSIGVEELFYLFWPLFFKKINIKRLVLATFLLWFVLKIAILAAHRLGIITTYFSDILLEFLQRDRFYSFVTGAAVAYAIVNKHKLFLKISHSPIIQFICLAIISAALFKTFKYSHIISNEVASIASGVIISGAASNLNIYNILGQSFIRFLGKISYGIYCYHSIVIVAVLKLLPPPASDTCFHQIVVYVVSMAGTILVATGSYYLLEIHFINLKKRFIAN